MKEVQKKALKVAIAVAALAVSALLLVLAGCNSAAFTVNGTTVSQASYNAEVARRIQAIKTRNPKELAGEKGRRLQAETRRQVATDLVRGALMEQQAAALKVQSPVAEATARVETEKGSEGADAFARRLREQHITEQRYIKELEGKVLVEEIGKKMTDGVTGTPDEAETYYLTHKDQFSRSAMVHAQHILFDTEGQAKMALDQIKGGDDFGQLAMAVSKDVATRGNGGDLGWIEQGTMDPEFEQAAFSLASGQVSDVVKASDGYHIIKVLERRDASEQTYEEVKDQAMQAMISNKKTEQFNDWLRTVYANAKVDVKNGVGKWDPRLGMIIENN